MLSFNSQSWEYGHSTFIFPFNLEYKARSMRVGFTTGSFTPERKEIKYTQKAKPCLLTLALPKEDLLWVSHVLHSSSGWFTGSSYFNAWWGRGFQAKALIQLQEATWNCMPWITRAALLSPLSLCILPSMQFSFFLWAFFLPCNIFITIELPSY